MTTTNSTPDTAATGELADRIDRLESRHAIHELVSEYCHGCDKRDIDRFMAIWHDDAVWKIGPPFGDVEGYDGVRKAMEELIWPAWRETHHLTSNLVVRFESADVATGECDVICEGADPTDVMQIVSATYTDRYERRDGVWKIAERAVVMYWFSAVPGVSLVPPA